jgi:hypothetical protein
VALRLQRPCEVPQVDLYSSNGVGPRHDVSDVHTKDPFDGREIL